MWKKFEDEMPLSLRWVLVRRPGFIASIISKQFIEDENGWHIRREGEYRIDPINLNVLSEYEWHEIPE